MAENYRGGGENEGVFVMKKILAFMLVVGLMATSANAALLISVNGVVNPPDTSITLAPSETAILDVYSDSIISAGVGETFYALVVAGGPGTIDTATGANVSGNVDAQFFGDAVTSGFYAAGVGVWGGLFAVGGPIAAGTLADGIIFHCDGLGDVTIELVEILADFSGLGQVLDTQVIHQVIPEPLTMGLLALGGLGLIRRRRA
jgi:hypothetical protein